MFSKLWHAQPGEEFNDGYLIGTGRLGGMLLGGTDTERVALNNEWLWRGEFRTRDTQKKSQHLAKVRELLLAGNYPEGTMEANKAFSGVQAKGMPNHIDPYQPAGDLHFALDHGPVENYRRELDLETAVATVQYSSGGINFKREYVAHLPCDLLLVHLTADKPFSGTFWLGRTEDPACTLAFQTQPDKLVMAGAFTEGIAFEVQVDIRAIDGSVTVDGDRVVVREAKEILLAIDVGTSSKGGLPADECALHNLPQTSWKELLAENKQLYRKLYDGFELNVDVESSDLPTDERLQAARDGSEDRALPVLHLNFARYLMIASTANAELPPNLQGKWNEQLTPPWDCDYHHDVNLQANYWFAEGCGLGQAVELLMKHIERLVPHARKAARDLYDCDGVYFPIQTDVWSRATPDSFGWAVWIGGAAWLAMHMWWRFEYGRDMDFLAQRAYPFFKEVAAFYESYLITDENGTYQVVPSQSPENNFVGGGTELSVALCVSSTMDVQLIRSVLGQAIKSAELLDVDAGKCQKWREILDHLPPLKIGKHGQLQEWNEDFQETKIDHRHYSHLIGVYPGDMMDPETAPDLWAAAKQSLLRRLENEGNEYSSFTWTWAACLFTRLGDVDRAWAYMIKHILNMSSNSLINLVTPLYVNLEDPHWFQIDGNFSVAAVILEMLLQSYHEELHLLPGLPSAWPAGSVKGLRGRGGYTLDITWESGLLSEAKISSLENRTCTILHAAGKYAINGSDGKEIQCKTEGHRIRFEVEAGKACAICPIA